MKNVLLVKVVLQGLLLHPVNLLFRRQPDPHLLYLKNLLLVIKKTNYKDPNPPYPSSSSEEKEVDNLILSKSDGDKKPRAKKSTPSQEVPQDSDESDSSDVSEKS